MRRLLALVVLLGAVAAAGWFFVIYRPSPRYAVGRLAAAVAVRDTAAIYQRADLAAIAEALATDVQSDAGRLLGRVLSGGAGGRPNPYLVSLAEQFVWTAMMQTEQAPALAGHVVGARAVRSDSVWGDSGSAVVIVPVELPSVRIDTTVAARLVFERRDGEWVLVAVRDVAAALLRTAMEAYLRETRGG
jgi:hypothetical protein